MSNAVLSVPDISCGHCESTIMKALTGQPGVSSVSVDIPGKTVALSYDEAQVSLDRVKELLADEDYPVESVVQQ